MEDTEMSIFSEQNEDQQFIILPSQEETEQESQIEHQLTKIVKGLPALQGTFHSSKVPDATSGQTNNALDPVIVDDQDRVVDSQAMEFISDSDEEVTMVENLLSDKGQDSEKTSQIAGDVDTGQGDVHDDDVTDTGDHLPISSSQEDMFKEDDCVEDERSVCTPAQHIASLQVSQNPMLVSETIDDTVNEIPPTQDMYGSTPTIIPSSPTQDIGNQLEIFDEEMCSNNPDVPIQSEQATTSLFKNRLVDVDLCKHDDDDDNMSSFHLDSADTLRSQTPIERKNRRGKENQDTAPGDVLLVSDGSLNMNNDPPLQQQPTQSQSFDNLLQPTLLGDDPPTSNKNKPDTSHCNIKQSSSSSLPSFTITCIEKPATGLEAPLSSQMLQGSDVIVINSDTHQSQYADSQELALHLSLTGSQVSSMSKSQTSSSHTEPFQQSGNTTVQSNNMARGGDREVKSAEKSVIEIDSEVAFVTSVPFSEAISVPCSDNPPEKVRSQSAAVEVEKITECNPKELNEQESVQVENNNYKYDEKTTDSDTDCVTKTASTKPSENTGSQSKSQESSIKQSGTKSHNEWKRARKRAKIQHMNDNPMTTWNYDDDTDNLPNRNSTSDSSSNRFSDEFHLVVPKPTSISDTTMETNVVESQNIPTEPLCAAQVLNKSSDVDDTLLLPPTTSCTTGQDQLILKMLDVDTMDTETSQSVFKLEKPHIEESTMLDNSEAVEPMFSNKRTRQARFILEDSDDEDLNLIEEKIQVVDKCEERIQAVSQSTPLASVESSEILVARKLETTTEVVDEEMEISQDNEEISEDNVATELECDDIQPVVVNKTSKQSRLLDSEDDEPSAGEQRTVVQEKLETYVLEQPVTDVQEKLTSRQQTGEHEEVFVAEKLDIAVESSETTQTYNPVVAMETDADGTTEKDATEIFRKTTRVRRVSEHATQTEDKRSEDLDGMDVNVTQKVVDYLQGACPTPSRSRSSSTCTDNSDSNKTPTGKKMEGTKSPKELQDVLKTYSDILKKKHRSRNKSGSDKNMPSSQAPNPAAADEGDKSSKEMIRRRLSTQSLPVDNTETSMNSFKRQFSLSAASNSNKTPGKKVHRHSVDSYNIGKIFDDVLTSRKNVPDELDNKIEKIEPHSGNKVHTLDSRNVSMSPDQPDKKSSVSEALLRTRLKSKSNMVNVDNKNSLTSIKLKTPAKDKSSVPHSVDLAKIVTEHKTNSKTKSASSSENIMNKRKSVGNILTSRTVSGSFVSSTQTFSVSKETSLRREGHDPYQFHGSQSQITSDEMSSDSNPLTSTKHQKPSDVVHEVDKNLMSSQTSIVTATTIGSSPHMPTSSSQSNAEIENVISQTSSSSIHSDDSNSRLLHRSQSDVLLSSPQCKNQMVTVVTETIERVYTEITTVRKVIAPQGNIIESSQDVQRFDPVVVKENTTKKYFPASSFNAGVTLTSSDLPDVASIPPSRSKRSNDEKCPPLMKSSESQPDPKPTVDSAYQDQSVSSSYSTKHDDTMVTSKGDIGARVIAKWKDDFYYPGCLKSSADRYSKYQVRFDDGDTTMVKGTDILCIERLPAGQSVMVLSDDEIFEFGLITGVQSDTYTIETDDGKSGNYKFSQVILSSDQALCILSDNGSKVTLLPVCTSTGQPVNYGDVSLENLIDAPRRSAKKAVKEEKEKQEKLTDKPIDTGRGRKRKLEMVEPSSSPKPGNMLNSPRSGRVMSSPRSSKVMSSPNPVRTSPSPVSKRRKVMNGLVNGLQASPLPHRKSTSKSRAGSSKEQLGPIPSKKLFNNIQFVLTNVDKCKEMLEQEKQLIQDISTDTSDDSALDEEIAAPFDKDHLKSQITAGGGTVLDNINEKMVSSGGRRIMLISSSYQRTLKYLQCLASGIPCISHMWIVDSCTQGHVLDEKSYILPAGVSLEKRKIMECGYKYETEDHKRNQMYLCARKKKRAIFQGIKAVVYSKDNQFVECWSEILMLGKCTVVKQLQYTNLHVIVTDSSCTSSMERQAKSKGIPVVGTEWVIQSLINGRLVSYTGNLKYRHDT